MLSVPDWEYRDVPADKISFATRAIPGIQMADLVTREIMKWLDNLATGYHAPRRPYFADLFDQKKICYHKYERTYFEGMKKHIEDKGTSMKPYHDWRRAQKLRDTTKNRIKYHFFRDIQNRGEPKV